MPKTFKDIVNEIYDAKDVLGDIREVQSDLSSAISYLLEAQFASESLQNLAEVYIPFTQAISCLEAFPVIAKEAAILCLELTSICAYHATMITVETTGEPAHIEAGEVIDTLRTYCICYICKRELPAEYFEDVKKAYFQYLKEQGIYMQANSETPLGDSLEEYGELPF